MASSNKTSLGFNNWTAQDKPARADFCNDNLLLDSLLAEHFSSEEHLTEEDKLMLAGVSVGTYTGDGGSTQQILLPFAARLVLVFRGDYPFCVGTNGTTEIYAAIAVQNAATGGAYLSGQTLLVRQTQEGTVSSYTYSLNKNGHVYRWAAFR